MPDFHLDERESLALALFLTADSEGRSATSGSDRVPAELTRRFERARAAYPKLAARNGETIFTALNCAGCHAHPSATAWHNAPDLSAEGSRVRPEWLRDFLRAPRPIRPFGFHPGSGSRMPDFRLSVAETDSISAYLLRQRKPLQPFEARTLSVFSASKAEALLRDRLPCLGCHQLGGDGGRIGPDLSGVRARLTPAFVSAMIRDPQHVAPGTVMPKTPLAPSVLELIANYLLGREPTAGTLTYLSLIDNPVSRPEAADNGQALYGRFCAHCHGSSGRANGFNARYLPTSPTAHADSAYMSTRPDATLYDAIHSGGYVVSRSNRMPAFGQTLSREQIWRLVRRIRELCACEGPAWSRDGQ